jgi:EAL domain-containing protein (putative c-di-GMP-specific phosphodiesterase class I)
MGLEALLRWQHPTRGLVMPDVFIDAAVESGLIEAITKSVVNQVCEQIAKWRKDGDFPELPVGVNVANTQFHDRRLPALVASALMRSGLPARLLVLELSEQTMVVDAVETERVVKELSNLGVRTAVGGFALGHGALKQLRQLRVAQIKLDRGFVHVLPGDEPSMAVVRAMIDVARRLKCQVIAEGVEEREQFEALRSLGCEAGQGFFFGPPLSAEEIRKFVAHHRAHPFI